MEWVVQHKTEYMPVVGVHHYNWLKLTEAQIRPVINHWIQSYSLNKNVPPGLVTHEGVMIDGNHRLEAVRYFGQGMWCCVVIHKDGNWLATAKSVWVV